MKAIVITTPGGPEVLKLQQVEDPVLKDDQVLIKVEATALNRADTLQRQGLYPPPKGESEYPGLECSGVVEKLGNNVSRWKVGDQGRPRGFSGAPSGRSQDFQLGETDSA
nr:quinone oxidoreductase PIG3 [Tanacetum cinerariifolium]GEZ09331.1 quinone oxidoreductase PIG3 [Tanacetum cinerariifolium]